MKLLGWMHRKFRQNGGEPIKDFVIGPSIYLTRILTVVIVPMHAVANVSGHPACNCISGRPSLDQEQNCYQLPKPTHYARPRRSSSSHSHHKDTFFRNSFAGIDEAGRENDDHDDPTDCAADEVYHGLLAIGTLGSDPVDHHRISVETITEKQQTEDVTADDLKLINDELEKELAKDEDVISSARNSHVSSVKQMEGSGGGDGNVNGGVAVAAVCPLQEYLFGSAVELPETTAAAKKEHRTSLGELFMRSRLAEENGGGGKVQGKSSGSEQQQQQQEKVRDHQVVGVQRMKKMLKRRTTMPIGSASKSSGGGGQSMAAGDSFSAETKLHKVSLFLSH
ncbi:hypothetical protein ACLOJK_008387 [Asimina triloba]